MVFCMVHGSCIELARCLARMVVPDSVYSGLWFLVVCLELLRLLILVLDVFTSLIAALLGCLLSNSLITMVVLWFWGHVSHFY
jgi:uncharacterized membrane protein YphA (DoxX/SURF4 family)